MSIHMGVRAFVVGLVLVMAAPVGAQHSIFIVDEQGGAGSSFTDLPEAIVAVPDGATLIVRPGVYSTLSISNKSLNIVGEDRDTVIINRYGAAGFGSDGIEIGPTARGQIVLVKNLTVHAGFFRGVGVSSAEGPVVFDSVKFDWAWFEGMANLQESANVHFHRCDLRALTGASISASNSLVQISHSTLGIHPIGRGCGGGTPGLHLSGSRCVAVASSITGEFGPHATVSLGAPPCGGPGGIGVVAENGSTFISLGTPVTGGAGGSVTTFGSSATAYFPGGNGIQVTENSVASFFGASPQGGAPGGGTALAGVPFVASSGGIVQIEPNATPSAGEIRGEMEVGKVIRFTLDARPGSVGIMVLAQQGSLMPLELPIPGFLLSPSLRTIGLLFVPSSGTVEWPYSIPSWWPLGSTYFGQYLTAELETGRIWATNSFAMHVNR